MTRQCGLGIRAGRRVALRLGSVCGAKVQVSFADAQFDPLVEQIQSLAVSPAAKPWGSKPDAAAQGVLPHSFKPASNTACMHAGEFSVLNLGKNMDGTGISSLVVVLHPITAKGGLRSDPGCAAKAARFQRSSSDTFASMPLTAPESFSRPATLAKSI